MAMERKTGLGAAAGGLLRPTTPIPAPTPTPPDEDSDREDSREPAEGKGRGETDARPTTRTRRKRPAPSGPVQGRKLYLPDDLHDRLRIYAMMKKVNVSTAAADLLDKALPRYRVEKEG